MWEWAGLAFWFREEELQVENTEKIMLAESEEAGMGTNSAWKPTLAQQAQTFCVYWGPSYPSWSHLTGGGLSRPRGKGLRSLLEKPSEPGRACLAREQSLGVKGEAWMSERRC